MRGVLLRVVALALVLGAGACDKSKGDGEGKGDDDSADATPADERVLVQAAAPTRTDLRQILPSSGTIEAERMADVLVEVTGTVSQILVEEGALVEAGQALARIDNPQLEGELLRARLAETRAKESHDSLRTLVDQGFVARNTFDEAAHAWDTARVALQQAEAAAGNRVLKTPIRGAVVRRDLRYGEPVSPPKLAFQVVDLERLELDLHVPERSLTRLAVGQPVVLRSEVLAVPGEAQILRISPVVDAQSGTVKVTVALGSEPGAFRAGMFVRADIVTATQQAALTIPKRAIVWDDGAAFAFVVADGVAVRRALELGIQDEDVAEVRSGLSEADRVVTIGQALLKDGTKVRADDGQPGEASAKVEAADPTPPATPAPEATPASP